MNTASFVPPSAVTWFEIPAADMARSKAFYEKLLDTQLIEEEMACDGETPVKFTKFPCDENKGVPGALCQGPYLKPASGGTVIYLACQDLDGALARLEGLGGALLFPKMSLPDGMGQIAVISDCDGNPVGLHQA